MNNHIHLTVQNIQIAHSFCEPNRLSFIKTKQRKAMNYGYWIYGTHLCLLNTFLILVPKVHRYVKAFYNEIGS